MISYRITFGTVKSWLSYFSTLSSAISLENKFRLFSNSLENNLKFRNQPQINDLSGFNIEFWKYYLDFQIFLGFSF